MLQEDCVLPEQRIWKKPKPNPQNQKNQEYVSKNWARPLSGVWM